MAINTAERRKAAAHIARPWAGKGLTPNAGADQEWRHEAAWLYPGILSGSFYTPTWMNESLRAYLNDQYSITNTDLVPLVDRYLDADSIADKTVSMRELKVATDVEER